MVHFSYLLDLRKHDGQVTSFLLALPWLVQALCLVGVGLVALLLTADLTMGAGRRTEPAQSLQRRLFLLFGLLCGKTPGRLQLLTGRRLLLASLCFVGGLRLLSLAVCNLIKTDLVVLDLSSLMNRPKDLLRSRHTVCFASDEKYLLDLQRAPADSVLRRLWDRGVRDDCMLEKNMGATTKLASMVYKVAGVAPLIYLCVASIAHASSATFC